MRKKVEKGTAKKQLQQQLARLQALMQLAGPAGAAPAPGAKAPEPCVSAAKGPAIPGQPPTAYPASWRQGEATTAPAAPPPAPQPWQLTVQPLVTAATESTEQASASSDSSSSELAPGPPAFPSLHASWLGRGALCPAASSLAYFGLLGPPPLPLFRETPLAL